MDYEIKEMKNLDLSDDMTWGNKAAYLSDARRNGVSVPDGFCVVMKEKTIDWQDERFRQDIKEYFRILKERTEACHYIVRSSFPYEDRSNHIFPGIYVSKKNISNYKDLLIGVVACHKSFRNEIVDMYMKEMDFKEPVRENFCIIIQEQIEPEYSGVAFTRVPIAGYYEMNSYLVEMVRGHCHNMLQGKDLANAYIVNRKCENSQSKRLNCVMTIDNEAEKAIFTSLTKEINIIIQLYGDALNIEWGYAQGKIVIFQIRPMTSRSLECRKEHASSAYIGLKAEAMKKFHNSGLFQGRLLIIEPGKSLAEIGEILKSADNLDGHITVRYSCNNELGLPRYFARGKDDAFDFISDCYKKEWAIIIHESISVRESYELYLDEDKAILEHVPGMWETDDRTPADMWVYLERDVVSYAAGCVREARYEETSGDEYCMIDPYGETEMKQVARMFFPYIINIRQNWQIKGGNNFHFVQDAYGKVFFLNYRKISRIRNWATEVEKVTVIECKEDLKKWKRGSILLNVDLRRGEEVLLKEYIPFLKKANTKVYVQFGILSHPSILLREMGIDVYPGYNLHKKYTFTVE